MTQSEKYFFVYHLFNKKKSSFQRAQSQKFFSFYRSMYLYVHYCINEPALF